MYPHSPRTEKKSRPVRLTVEQLESRDLLSAGAGLDEVFLLATPADPSFSQLYGMQKIQAPAAWDISKGSTSVIVADIDTGIDYTHPDLYLNVWINQGEIPAAVKTLKGTEAVTFYDLNMKKADNTLVFGAYVRDTNANGVIDGKDLLNLWTDGVDSDSNGYKDDLIGWNFVKNSNDPYDDNGHGTHTAGTIGAIGNNGVGVAGVNWNVQIMALKFLAGDGSGSLAGAAAAIRYAANNGARVSNNSWGYYRGVTNDVIYQAIAYAQTKNHLVIAAAGNDGVNNDSSYWKSFPASFTLSNVIAVAATNSSDVRASWSNYGKTSVDLAAPGVNIVSTVPGGSYASYSGTSMATPHVAGTAALLLSVKPNLTTAQLKSLILNNVDPVSSLRNRTVTGGRLNAYKAINAALGTVTSASTTSGTSAFSFGGRFANAARAASEVGGIVGGSPSSEPSFIFFGPSPNLSGFLAQTGSIAATTLSGGVVQHAVDTDIDPRQSARDLYFALADWVSEAPVNFTLPSESDILDDLFGWLW